MIRRTGIEIKDIVPVKVIRPIIHGKRVYCLSYNLVTDNDEVLTGGAISLCKKWFRPIANTSVNKEWVKLIYNEDSQDYWFELDRPKNPYGEKSLGGLNDKLIAVLDNFIVERSLLKL